jgi:hypothetical protein
MFDEEGSTSKLRRNIQAIGFKIKLEEFQLKFISVAGIFFREIE